MKSRVIGVSVTHDISRTGTILRWINRKVTKNGVYLGSKCALEASPTSMSGFGFSHRMIMFGLGIQLFVFDQVSRLSRSPTVLFTQRLNLVRTALTSVVVLRKKFRIELVVNRWTRRSGREEGDASLAKTLAAKKEDEEHEDNKDEEDEKDDEAGHENGE